MKRPTRLGVTFVMLATMFGLVIGGSLPASGQSNGGSKGVGPASLQRLRRDAIGDVKMRVDRGTRYVGFARVASGGDLFPGSRSATPQGKARGFLAGYAGLFGIRDASAELRLVSATTDAQGFTHVSFAQTYKGLPVFAGLVRAHLDRGNRLTAVNGTLVPNVELNTDARLSPAQAAQKAIADVLARPPATEESADGAAAAAPTGLRAASITLEVYRMGLVRNVPGSNQLVYEVEVTNGADVREFVFVHANAGKIVNRYSGVHNDLFRRVFEANFDPDSQVWEEGDPFPGALTEDQQNIVTFSGHSYHFFSHAFGRDSYDGEGAEMQTVNNDPRINCPNANWNGITTNYCTGVTGDDTVAHEWGHAYTEYTHNLIYQWQSGALNESYSDIWGDVVDLINGAGADTPGGNRAVGTCSSQTSHKNWPTVIVNQPASLGRCAAAPAAFGPALTTAGVTDAVVLASDGKGSPTDGCTNPNNGQAIAGNIALVDRGTCTFTAKVANMQKVGATGVMIVNNIIGGPTIMPGVDPSITIPSVMISTTAGASLKQALPGLNVTMRARATSGSSFRWLSGEDDPAFNGAIRDMWDPTCLGDPGKVTDQEYFCAGDDNGGVHSNSGVPNHGFALLVDGGTYNGQTVAGIGLTKAAHLYWRAGSVYQTPSSDFPDHADSLLASCNDLVGVRLPNLGTGSTPPGGPRQAITSADCAAVGAMTAAVELRTDPTTQCNFRPILEGDAPPVCGGQAADVLYTEDFETGLDGWTLTNQGVFAGWPGLDWTTDSSLPAGEAGSAAFGADPDIGDCGAGTDDVSGVMRMESPPVTLPGGTMRLSFDHYIATEQGWDGGNVSMSVNGRAYALIPASAFLFNPYNATLQTAAAGNTNPLAGQPGFTGTDAGELVSSWGTSIIDLGATGARLRPGDTVRFRFDMGMDGCTGIDGWYVDDVTVSVCGTPAVASKEDAASA
ncbi:MAG: Thermolysin metallopeptidase [Actinomycetia bacterium]|jgi:Zn-dependent metalloprotease|nr:Thermolysin metallopeptidase [Actinomycetes bacterium]